jgi:hypothetical protein
MTRVIAFFVALTFIAGGMSGCGSGDVKSVKLAPVTGIVKYNGAPIAGVRVMFFPDKGPLAVAETDLEGKFTLKSGALAGCAVGPVKATVSVPEDSSSQSMSLNPSPKTPEEFAENSKKMAEMTTKAQQAQQSKGKSLIPTKYKDASTSGLSYTVESGGLKDLTIELKD